MGMCLPFSNCQHGIQKQYPLLSPLNKISVIWNCTANIRMQFFINIF